jgi:uncharacterized protein (DUF58 family)
MDDGANALRLDAERLAQTLPPLLVAAERVAATVSQGVHGRRRVGQGETFWQYRRYQSGDSTQSIDWRQSAKAQPVYVRETEWEAAQSVWLWRDGSASMNFRSGNALATKRERASLLTMALAVLLVRGGERVAAMGSGVPPATGRAGLMRIANWLDSDGADGAGAPGPEPIPRHARVVLVGDFLSSLNETRDVVAQFRAQGVRGHMVQVLDPAETTLPFDGRVWFEGPEGEGDLLVGRVEGVREAYAEIFRRHEAGLRAIAELAGWSFAVHWTEHAPETALMGMYLALSMPAGDGAGLSDSGPG